MPKMPNQKLKLIYLIRIFEERTDNYHGLTLPEISRALAEYDISAERKSLYDDIEVLKLCGYDIRTVRDSRVRYYLASRKFERAELCILCDSVAESRLITEKKTAALIKKLSELGSKYDAAEIKKRGSDITVRKTETEDIYGNIATVHKAILENKKIRFYYFEWNSNKQRILTKNGEEYLLDPVSLVHDGEFYFLSAYDPCNDSLEKFRIDKMIKLRAVDQKREGAALVSDSRYNSEHSRDAHDVEVTNVRILADNSLAGAVIDRYGTGITILNHGDKFEFITKVKVCPEFYSWVLSLGNKIKILSPEDVAKETLRIAEEVVSVYKDK